MDQQQVANTSKHVVPVLKKKSAVESLQVASTPVVTEPTPEAVETNNIKKGPKIMTAKAQDLFEKFAKTDERKRMQGIVEEALYGRKRLKTIGELRDFLSSKQLDEYTDLRIVPVEMKIAALASSPTKGRKAVNGKSSGRRGKAPGEPAPDSAIKAAAGTPEKPVSSEAFWKALKGHNALQTKNRVKELIKVERKMDSKKGIGGGYFWKN